MIHSAFRAIAYLGFLVILTAPVRAQDQPRWPREIVGENGGVITVYQPQVESFSGNRLEARAAVSVKGRNMAHPVFGAAWFNARVFTDRDERLVYVEEVSVPRVRFPEATADQEARLIEILEREIPRWDLTLSLDELLTGLELGESQLRTAEELKTDPPVIHARTHPAVLVTLDGEPELRPLEEDARLQRVVNTPYVMLRDSSDYWLYAGTAWFSARQLNGPWGAVTELPDYIARVGKQIQEQEQEQEQEQQQRPGETVATDMSHPPEIIVSTVPAELIAFEGEPSLVPVEGDGLLYVSNTDSNVLLEIEDQSYYVVISGRWYRSSSLDGPWVHVSADALPPSFAAIPQDSEKAGVRTYVAGTPEAEEAVLDSFIPQTAEVRLDAEPPDVTYDGDPIFETVVGTSMTYAANTAYQIIRAQGSYWLCYEGVWYVANSPFGPWRVATGIPQEIYSIPPSNPNYNVTYVHVYESTPQVVYVGYYPGYVGSYVYGPTVVYGTGWYYHGWYGPRYWYPRPVTFGYHVGYNPWTGWNFGFFRTGPFYFGVGTAWRPYHARWSGGWYRPGGWWGVGGYRHTTVNITRNVNIYTGNKVVHRNIYNREVNRGKVVRIQDRVAQSRDKGQRERMTVSRDRANNVYTDHDGNVYRRQDSGTWQKRDKNVWRDTQPAGVDRGQPGRSTARTAGGGQQPRVSQEPRTAPKSRTVQQPSKTYTARGTGQSSLDRQYQSRQRGAQRTRSYSSSRSAGKRRR